MYTKGLKGVVAVETHIASVDGENGVLRYRGKTIEEVVDGGTFESVAAYLWDVEAAQAERVLQRGRELGEQNIEFLKTVPRDLSLMDQVRTVMSTLATPYVLAHSNEEQAMLLAGAIPVVTAAAYRMTNGHSPVSPDPALSHVANYLYMISGKKPTDTATRALETYLITTMEHGMNASTFAARVTVSSESDLPSGLVSALGTMKGPLHGGAPSGVLTLLDEIKQNGSIKAVIQQKLDRGERIMGFGHRVYKTEDPRSLVLRHACERLGEEQAWLSLAVEAEKEIIRLLDLHKPGRRLYTNVEYYAAAIMKSIDLSPELFTPTFSVARSVGWTAHIGEQLSDNVIFRPESVYVGAPVYK